MTKPPGRRRSGARQVEWDQRSEQPLLGSDDDEAPFNPLDTKNLAVAVAKALLEKRARPLDALARFRGAGIYSIYYAGDFSPYRLIAAENQDFGFPRWPIYVGKAIPAGGRRGSFNIGATDTLALFNRLNEHAESVRAARSLRIEDFRCRFLVIQDLWIPLAEALLINHFAPIWNQLIDGFGNHDPGSGRYNGARPRWDVLHPGREWAERCKQRIESEADICREITVYLSGAAVPSLKAIHGDLSGK